MNIIHKEFSKLEYIANIIKNFAATEKSIRENIKNINLNINEIRNTLNHLSSCEGKEDPQKIVFILNKTDIYLNKSERQLKDFLNSCSRYKKIYIILTRPALKRINIFAIKFAYIKQTLTSNSVQTKLTLLAGLRSGAKLIEENLPKVFSFVNKEFLSQNKEVLCKKLSNQSF